MAHGPHARGPPLRPGGRGHRPTQAVLSRAYERNPEQFVRARPKPPDKPDKPDHPHNDNGKKTPPPGALTVRTTPYSDVYLGKKLLGQTPFADVAISPGPHILTFRHPGKKPFTKKVEITSGKTTRLNFALP